ncbi:hypothetical protein [Micromonospora sp. CB01531]|uniref:hypothetical protein n=1 Tax=Micromonospora sp. CB01531 TaxID=1718947 RepID=UPI0009395B38|nr:hypothetical protein [Micromonospora sp. CB01531]OKI65508.1 hypothetical protein A6A27_24295 [Micromonospora sp. CB01531]
MSIPLRWRLLDEKTGATLADCTDIDGLFVDRVFPSEPLYERYTLLSCAPSGPLLAAIDGTGPAWFGNFVLEGADVPGPSVNERHQRTAGRSACGEQCRGSYETMEELLDVGVVGHRPAAEGSGLLDIDVEGHRRDDHNNCRGIVVPAVFGYRLFAWSTASGAVEERQAGECRDIVGQFHGRPETWPPGPQLTLLGCHPGLTDAGVSLRDVQIAARHADPRTTMRARSSTVTPTTSSPRTWPPERDGGDERLCRIQCTRSWRPVTPVLRPGVLALDAGKMD